MSITKKIVKNIWHKKTNMWTLGEKIYKIVLVYVKIFKYISNIKQSLIISLCSGTNIKLSCPIPNHKADSF